MDIIPYAVDVVECIINIMNYIKDIFYIRTLWITSRTSFTYGHRGLYHGHRGLYQWSVANIDYVMDDDDEGAIIYVYLISW